LAGLLAAVFLTFFTAVFLVAVFFAAAFFAGAFLAAFFTAPAFFAARTLVVFSSVLALLAFFAFFAMIVLPIVAADFPTHRGAIKHDFLDSLPEHDLFQKPVSRFPGPCSGGTYLPESPIASDYLVRSNALGTDPPVAQSISSIG
jgi:hypothetical protein